MKIEKEKEKWVKPDIKVLSLKETFGGDTIATNEAAYGIS